MIARLNKNLLFTLLVTLYFLFSYYIFDGWWYSSIGSILIIFLSSLIWGKGFLKQIGLQLNLLTIAKAIILATIVTTCALLVMRYIGNMSNIRIDYTNWRNYYHDIFYILNEEIVIGAILLFAIVNKWKVKPIVACLLLAVFFSLIHFIFYRWIFLERGIIGIPTLITLFLVGFARNSLILLTGHIGYSWALHFGWMVIMFGSMHTNVKTNLGVSETERFNLYLGSTEMLIISIIMAGIFLAYWIKKHMPQHAE
ncbi:MAG: hypothetical protein QNK33_01620 [Bacteroidales bacterium]|nr:hypothetical protein [Bacteroidales bacterium]